MEDKQSSANHFLNVPPICNSTNPTRNCINPPCYSTNPGLVRFAAWYEGSIGLQPGG